MNCGRVATIPAKMMIETPLPTPFCVISSPIQTRRTVPAIIVMITASVGINDELIVRALARFDARVPDAKDIRDVIEHFDDYARGKGKLQKSERLDHPWLDLETRHENGVLRDVEVIVGDELRLSISGAFDALRTLVDEVMPVIDHEAPRYDAPPHPIRGAHPVIG